LSTRQRGRTPTISVVIPARNEGDRVEQTLESLVHARSAPDVPAEAIVVDDASEDDLRPRVRDVDGLRVRLVRLDERVGVPRARNAGADAAHGEILFITDAHVEVGRGWDEAIVEHARDSRILAGAVSDPTSAFRAFGCTLVIPFMGTRWLRDKPTTLTPVQIPSCAATVVPRALFVKLGGYDHGMRLYAAAEPEFGVRAWLAGAEILALPELEVAHRFKERDALDLFIDDLRPSMVHNSLRFGVLYLSDAAILQMLRYYAFRYPDELPEALEMLQQSDVWERRAQLERTLARTFDWFLDRFELRDQDGGEIFR
jgi:glycosyltransferase involved in cell wall biosynthesis